jgi:hypothetical protein
MSKGPGRIERAIRALFDVPPLPSAVALAALESDLRGKVQAARH